MRMNVYYDEYLLIFIMMIHNIIIYQKLNIYEDECLLRSTFSIMSIIHHNHRLCFIFTDLVMNIYFDVYLFWRMFIHDVCC